MNGQEENIENLFSGAFEQYQVAPSPKVWKKLAVRIGFRHFVTWQAGHFNVYYLGGSVAAALVTTALWVIQPSGNEHKTDNDIVVSQSILTDSTQKTEGNTIENEFAVTTSGKEMAVTQTIHSGQITNDIKTVRPEPTHVLPFKKQELSNTSADSNQSIPVIAAPTDTAHAMLVADHHEEMQNHSNQDIANRETPETGISFLKSLSLPWKLNRVLPPDTLPLIFLKEPASVWENIVPAKEEKPNRKTTVQWMAEPYAVALNTRPLIKSNGSENTLYARKLKNLTSPNLSWGSGVNAVISSGKFQAVSGIMLASLDETFSKNTMAEEVDSMVRMEVNVTNYVDYDTSWVLGVDSVYHPVVDSVWAMSTDTVFISEYDTVFDVLKNRLTNKTRYFEIPLLAGYSFQKGPFTLTPRLGIILGILRSASGTSVQQTDSLAFYTYSQNSMPLRKAIFSGYVGLNCAYLLEKKWDFFGEFYYRRTFSSIYDESYAIHKKLEVFGVKIGLRYHF